MTERCIITPLGLIFIMSENEKNEKLRRRPGRRPIEEGSAQDTRRDILDHALSQFNERGYAAVSVEEIAAAAGVTKATLYYHFPGKPEIFVESIRHLASKIHAMIEGIVTRTDLPVTVRLSLIVQTRREFFATMSFREGLKEEAQQFITAEQEGRIHQSFVRVHGMFRELMAEGVVRGELKQVNPDILASAFGQLMRPTAHEGIEYLGMEVIDNAMLKLFFEGAQVTSHN